MKQIKLNFAVFAASLCALLVLAAAPVVMAYDEGGVGTGTGGSGSGPGTGTGTGGSGSGPGSSGTGSGSGSGSGESEKEVSNKADTFQKNGSRELKLKRAAETRQVKSKEQRARTCQNIQKAVNRKLTAFNNHADKYLARLDAYFTNLQAYQTENNLPVNNYGELLATAVQKQSDATVAVEALNSLGTTIDCTSSDPASMLTSVKSGASDARDALKDYRKSLKDIVIALIQANRNEDTTEDN